MIWESHVLKNLGWKLVQEDDKTYLVTNEFMPRRVEFPDLLRDLMDYTYSKGHQDGWSRGAYEMEQQEDVEPEDRNGKVSR